METTMPSQVDEGQEPITGSPQATETTAQPQETTPVQVENGQLPSSQEDTRKASDFETARQLKRLMKEFQSLKQTFERSSQSPAPSPSPSRSYPVTKEELFTDPISGIGKIAATESERNKQEITQMIQTWKHDQLVQEGNRLINTNELVKKDPEGREKIDAILTEEDENGNSLQKYSFVNPKHAAQLALKEYQNRYGNNRPPVAPTKAQMRSTATSQVAGAGQSTSAQQIEVLHKQLADYPDLMKDKAFMAKVDAVMKQHTLETRTGK